MATEGGGMKGSTILLIVVVLWFLSTQIGKLTGSLNKASGAANNVAKPLNQVGGAAAGLINAGSSAIGRWLSGNSGGSSSSSSSSSAADSAPSFFSTSGVGSSSNDAYAPGASAPGPFAPSGDGSTPSAWGDDLATPDWADA